jgi:hypothetical protein
MCLKLCILSKLISFTGGESLKSYDVVIPGVLPAIYASHASHLPSNYHNNITRRAHKVNFLTW